MPRGIAGLPKAQPLVLSKKQLLEELRAVDTDPDRRSRVLRLETAFRTKIANHIMSLPAKDAMFQKFNTSPYVLLIHALQRGYTKVSEIEADILPAKQFSSMETSAGRMVEEIALPEYGWECVTSIMHSSNSALDGKRIERGIYHLATLKSGPRCLNDEMSENFADAVLNNFTAWAAEASVKSIDFTYGVLYGTRKMSNKKDWHILRNIQKKLGSAMRISPDNRWSCGFTTGDIVVDVTIRIGLDWWRHLGGELCFTEVFTALIRACVSAGVADTNTHHYVIRDLDDIVSMRAVPEEYNVSLLQHSQISWFFLMARHFCDSLTD